MSSSVRKKILLAELDDRMALVLLARLYEHNRTLDVLLSRTADVTSELTKTETFHAIVTRAHPGKPSDVQQLRDAARARILALIDGEVGVDSGVLYAAGADTVLATRTPVELIAGEALRLARSEALLEGQLDQLGAPELVQILCLCRRTASVRLESPAGRAVVWIRNGEVHHAVCEALSGQSAMAAIVRADSGRFWALPGDHMPVRSIEQNWQHVLLEAAREGDEARESTSRREPTAEHGPKPSQSQVRKLGRTYRELTELGLQSIKAGDFSKAREFWDAARAIGPEDGEPDAPLPKSAGSVPPPRRVERG
jgi:hypothetical protein